MSKKSSVVFSLRDPEICATFKMKITHMELFAKKIYSQNFRIGGDVEANIEKCEKKFQDIELPEAKHENISE